MQFKKGSISRWQTRDNRELTYLWSVRCLKLCPASQGRKLARSYQESNDHHRPPFSVPTNTFYKIRTIARRRGNIFCDYCTAYPDCPFAIVNMAEAAYKPEKDYSKDADKQIPEAEELAKVTILIIFHGNGPKLTIDNVGSPISKPLSRNSQP